MVKRKHDNEFKQMIVELLLAGHSTTELGKEYDLNVSMINRWRREYKEKSGDFSKRRNLSPEELELKALKKELREVTLERDILKKAVSIFSKRDR